MHGYGIKIAETWGLLVLLFNCNSVQQVQHSSIEASAISNFTLIAGMLEIYIS